MSYGNFRSDLSTLEYVNDIYVEIRNLGAGDKIVEFFDIDDTAATPAQIPQSRATYWANSTLRLDVMNQLNSVHPAYLVFCDAEMKEFHVHSSPFSEVSYECLNEPKYINFVQGLNGARMTGRPAQGPKYPDKLSPYSLWHYKLDWACKCRDIDYLEIRNGRVKAALEITGNLRDENHLRNSINKSSEKNIFKRWPLHQSMFRSLETSLEVPAYFVVHTDWLDVFCVFDVNFNQVFYGDQTAYAAWLSQL